MRQARQGSGWRQEPGLARKSDMSDTHPFNQPPPRLGNQYDEDAPLRELLARRLPPDLLARIEPELREMGELAGGTLYRQQLEEWDREPRLVRWAPWGERIDRVETTPLWERARRLAADKGVLATAYERRDGAFSRVHQYALAYLFVPSTEVFGCPLAMSDGAARTLIEQEGGQPWAQRSVARLTSRDPAEAWTSGQWMTESTGGSDVGTSESVARRQPDGSWRLWGRKWFVSAVTAEMALVLARPEGNGPGGEGLAVFYVESGAREGWREGLRIERLKDKLGTRKLPTAEVWLEGVAARLVGEPAHGTRTISTMLNVTRTWNAITAAATMRRGIALARDYARRRRAFGGVLAEKPLHLDALAWAQAEQEGALQLAFEVAWRWGRIEAGEADDEDRAIARLLTPVAKLWTARQGVAVASECLEAFGGAGIVEDTGLPVLLRDSQIFAIWEGTTNVLALDVLRALGRSAAPLEVLGAFVRACVREADDDALASAGHRAEQLLERATAWLGEARRMGRPALEGGARRFAVAIGRVAEIALLVRQARWSEAHGHGPRARAAALRLAASDPWSVQTPNPALSRALAMGEGAAGR